MINKFKLDNNKNTATKEVITRTLEIASNYAGELSIEVLALDKIELDPENNRELSLTLPDALNGIDPNDPLYEKKKQDWKSLESLAKTIVDDQLINPIYVYRYGNKCRLIAGERRTLASAIAGKKEIIARIASQRPTGSKLKVLQWIENNERVDLSLSERIASLEAIIREYYAENKDRADERLTAKLLSDLTGMSITQSRRYILILQAKPEIKKAIESGKLENIKLIELICSIERLDHQQEIFNMALNGNSFESIIRSKNDLEMGNKNKRDIRGINKSSINLGVAQPHTVKIIIDALITTDILETDVIERINNIYQAIQWENNSAVEKSFKKIISQFNSGA